MFSFIVVNYKTPELSEACLRSILAKSFAAGDEIIIIDNGSGDDSVVRLQALAAEFNPVLHLLLSPFNRGFAAANNLGAQVARGDYLFFVNSDTIFKDNVAKKMRTIFETEKSIGILAPRLISPQGQKQEFSFGAFPSLRNLIFRRKKIKTFVSDGRNLQTADWVSGAAVAIRRELWEKIKPWDEAYFMYYEDVDLCWRAQKSGYQAGVLNTAPLVHLGGGSWNLDKDKKNRYYQAQTYFFRKHYGLVSVFFLRLLRLPRRVKWWFK